MLEQLPPKIKAVLGQYLQPLCKEVPEDSLLLDLLVKIAQVAIFRRVTVESIDTIKPVPTNIYGIIFMPSGEGKDKPLRLIDQGLMQGFYSAFKIKKAEEYDAQMRALQDEASEQFQKSNAEKERYISNNSPMELIEEMSDATIEGFMKMRETYSICKWGGTFTKVGEFADYISTRNNARLEFISALVEVFDTGDSKPKIIKGQKHYKSVENVPSIALLHSSPVGLRDGYPKKQILQFLNRGLARRSLICFPQPTDYKSYASYEEYRQAIAKAQGGNEMIAKFFSEALSNKLQANFVLDDEANRMVYEYRTDCRLTASKLSITEETLAPEIKNRSWKMTKLAGLIAFFEHPGVQIVTAQDVDFAITIVDHFGQYLEKFIESSEPDEVEKLFNFLHKNLGKRLTTMDLRKQNFVHKDKFAHWFETAIVEAENIATSKGFELLTLPGAKNNKSYCMITPKDLAIKTARAYTEFLKDEFDK